MRKADGAQRCDERQAAAFGKRRGGRRHESGSGHDGVPKTLTRRSLRIPANPEADASILNSMIRRERRLALIPVKPVKMALP